MVSIGGASPIPLSGGIWYDHVGGSVPMSFYNFPLTNLSATYLFSNPAKIIVYGYGNGSISWAAAYYYLAGSAMRNLFAAFTANNIPYNDMHNNPFCEHDITFVANIEGIHPNQGSLKWYIDGALQSVLTDHHTWNQNFPTGNYVIEMSVLFEDNTTKTYEDTLKIAACEAVFYANNVLHANLQDTTFCDKVVNFRSDVEGLHPDPGRIKWYINDPNHLSPLHVDETTWSQTYNNGEHHDDVEMVVRFENGETETIYGRVNVRVFWTSIKNIQH